MNLYECNYTSVESDFYFQANKFLFYFSEYDSVASAAMNITKDILNIQHVLVIQPYIKWGPKKSNVSPDLKLQETEALVRSIPTWSIVHSIKVPLETFDKNTFFGSGKIEELRLFIRKMSSAGKKV